MISEDVRLQAAKLTFAMLRYESCAAHPDLRSCRPQGAPRVGEDAYIFLPALRPIACADVVAFLAGLPSPALLSPTTKRGIVALTLLSELSGDREHGARKIFANQRASVDGKGTALNLTPESRILLELPEEKHKFSFEALRAWSEHFAVHIGWQIEPAEPGSDFSAQLLLVRSDRVKNLST